MTTAQVLSTQIGNEANAGYDEEENELGISLYDNSPKEDCATIVLSGSVGSTTAWFLENELKNLHNKKVLLISFENVHRICPQALTIIENTVFSLRENGGAVILCGSGTFMNVLGFQPVFVPIIFCGSLHQAEEHFSSIEK